MTDATSRRTPGRGPFFLLQTSFWLTLLLLAAVVVTGWSLHESIRELEETRIDRLNRIERMDVLYNRLASNVTAAVRGTKSPEAVLRDYQQSAPALVASLHELQSLPDLGEARSSIARMIAANRIVESRHVEALALAVVGRNDAALSLLVDEDLLTARNQFREGRIRIQDAVRTSITEDIDRIGDIALAGAVTTVLAAVLVLGSWFLSLGQATRWRRNQEAAQAALAREVEERRRAEESLRETNALLSTVIDTSPVAIRGVDRDGNVFVWNRESERLFGYTLDEVRRPDFSTSVQRPDDREEFERLAALVLRQGRLRDHHIRRETAEGRRLDVLASAEILRHADGSHRGILFAFIDVSQRTAIEEQLRQAQKMEAVGQLTGGLAHDFNNLLAVVIGNLDLLEDRVRNDREAVELVASAREAGWRGAELTSMLLAFARRQPLQPRRIDIAELLARHVRMMSRLLGAEIAVKVHVAPDLWAVEADPTQLETALTNLATNARDAMPGGGTLSIQARNGHLDAEYAASHADVRPGDYVVIEVSDTGQGMPPELLARAVEPFFTTKKLGQGTGLGLSMVFGFVKQSGGHLRLYSEVGLGTTVSLYLPRATSDGQRIERTPDVALARAEPGETVLVAEDTDGVRRILVTQLRDLGYTVLQAADAAEAMAVLERPGRIDLLLTDVVMPGGMSGIDLAERAREMRPGLRILLTSGYPASALTERAQVRPDMVLLPKPVRRQDLAAKIREALRRPAEAPH